MDCLYFEVDFLPALIPDSDRSSAAVVMTDVLRASTTMITALANGAATIWPHASIDSARQAKLQLPDALLCGERGGKKIDGFDCGNSPLEFPPERANGQTLIHCTTNGTVALERCRGAARVLIGAFVNLDALAFQLATESRAVVVCAGTDGNVTGEDILFAGAVGHRLQSCRSDVKFSDAARVAVQYWKSEMERTDLDADLSEVLGDCRGGRPLRKLGYQRDIDFCAQIGKYNLVPELDQDQWRIGLP